VWGEWIANALVATIGLLLFYSWGRLAWFRPTELLGMMRKPLSDLPNWLLIWINRFFSLVLLAWSVVTLLEAIAALRQVWATFR